MHEIHAPAFLGASGARRWGPVEGDVLAPLDPHAELQPVEPIQPTHPRAVDRPAFAAQQHPDAQMSTPRPRVGELVPRPTAAIPGRSTELRQPTGPRTADLERHLETTRPAPDGARAS